MIRNGIDRRDEWGRLLKGKRVGLLTSAAGCDRELRRNVDCLLSEGVRLTALYGPEHGVNGAVEAGGEVAAQTDAKTGVPVYSLYRKDSKRLSEELLRDVDTLVYDIADVGARFYTYATTLLYTLEDCARFQKELVVLDRLNPLGGAAEGCGLDKDCESFIGGYDMPVRYGLTAGELALLANAEQRVGCKLHVVQVEGWKRSMLFSDTDLCWLPPSPALQHFDNALLYPGTCLIEGVNVSEGRGSADPFALIGAPYIDGETLAECMNAKQLAGVRFLPVAFTPAASKYAGESCRGVKLLLTERHAYQAVRTGLMLMDAIRSLWPEAFAYLPPNAEFGRPSMDLLSGSRRLREGQTVAGWLADAEAYERQFAERSKPYRLYTE